MKRLFSWNESYEIWSWSLRRATKLNDKKEIDLCERKLQNLEFKHRKELKTNEVST